MFSLLDFKKLRLYGLTQVLYNNSMCLKDNFAVVVREEVGLDFLAPSS